MIHGMIRRLIRYVSSYLKYGTLDIIEIIHISRSIHILHRNVYLLGGG